MKQTDNRPAENQTDPKSQTWDVAGVTFFRTLGYVVGLPSLIIGIVLFVLGYAFMDISILHTACLLCSLALIAIGGRPVLLQLKPQNKSQAFNIVLGAGIIFFCCYSLLITILMFAGIDMI